MKILAVCNLFPPYVVGGNELRLRQLLEALRARHDVGVLTAQPPPEMGAVQAEPWVVRELRQIVPYPRPVSGTRLYFVREWGVSAYNRFVTGRLIEEFRPDVVLMSDLKRVFLGPAFAASEHGVPIVWDVTDTSLENYRNRRALRTLLPWMDLRHLPLRFAMTNSDYVRDVLTAQSVFTGPVSIVRQGIALRDFEPRGSEQIERVPRRLLWVGSLIEDKGLHTVLRALARLVRDDPEYTLTVCGDSGDERYKQRLREYVRGRGLQRQVTFCGRLAPGEVARKYREHDVYVFSSEWPEPFATTPLEAMATRIPVVGTPVGGQKALFEMDRNALLFEPGDPRGLARQVRRLDDADLRRRLVIQAHELVTREYSLEAYAGRVERVLERAANTRRAAAAPRHAAS
jgi:glycosyltransferase involved in cell wall biosynthesis